MRPLPSLNGVNAEKNQNEHRNQQKWINTGFLHGIIKGGAEIFHGPGRLPGRYRFEPDPSCTVWQLLCNHVIGIFEASADGCAAEPVQIPVHLQNGAGPDRDIVVAFTNRCQYIAIAGDLPLAAVPGRRPVLHQSFQAVICRNDAFYPIGRLRALNPGDLQKAWSECPCALQ